MERQKGINIKYSKVIIVILYLVGIAGHLNPATRNIMLTLTPYTLLLAGVLVIVSSSDKSNVKLFQWMIITYSFTFLSEVIGIHTGFVFGDYTYGDTLGLKFLGVPMIIGFNWVLIILGAINIAESIEKNAFTTSMLAAVLAVLFDLILEPIAIKLDYWNWLKGGIPLRNYYAWFGIAFISSYLYKKIGVRISTDNFRFYFIIQLIFFVVLSLFMA